MSFQNIAFRHNNIGVDSELDGFVAEKLDSLSKYVNASEARVEVEYERVASHRQGEICRVEVNITTGRDFYRAENTKETFEAAIILVRDELDKEMNKAQNKRSSLFRRGARRIKEMMRFGQ
jgi:ribosomal subunit interface protein